MHCLGWPINSQVKLLSSETQELPPMSFSKHSLNKTITPEKAFIWPPHMALSLRLNSLEIVCQLCFLSCSYFPLFLVLPPPPPSGTGEEIWNTTQVRQELKQTSHSAFTKEKRTGLLNSSVTQGSYAQRVSVYVTNSPELHGHQEWVTALELIYFLNNTQLNKQCSQAIPPIACLPLPSW